MTPAPVLMLEDTAFLMLIAAIAVYPFGYTVVFICKRTCCWYGTVLVCIEVVLQAPWLTVWALFHAGWPGAHPPGGEVGA